VDATTHGTDELAAENERLKARVEALEAELAQQAARANAAVARAEERVYWLDRWRIDLNALMRLPGARGFSAVMEMLRTARHKLQALRRRLAG
jgi:cell division septum initiation protein DivIVA